MSAMDKQVGGTHYKDMPVQPLDVMRDVMGDENYCYFLLGNIIKYRMRSEKKEGSDDVAKADHYSELLQEVMGNRPYESKLWMGIKYDWSAAEDRLMNLGF